MRRALAGPAPAAEVVARAAAFLREMAPRLAPPVAAAVGHLLDDLGAA